MSLDQDNQIHIIMCCWKRVHNLSKQIDNLIHQTVSHMIHLHLINNNKNEKQNIDTIIRHKQNTNQYIKITCKHYDNTYNCFQRHFYIRDILLKDNMIKYVIFIDDDQIFPNDWVERLWSRRESKIYTGWYTKTWRNNKDYWNGSIITLENNMTNELPHMDLCHYIGPGGSLIDTFIFHPHSLLWNVSIIPEQFNVYEMDDIWLSYVAFFLHFKVKRSFVPIQEEFIDETSLEKGMCNMLQKKKKDFFEHLYNMNSLWITNLYPDFCYVTIGITTCNHPEALFETLKQITKNTWSFNVIITDTSTEDKSKKLNKIIVEKYKIIKRIKLIEMDSHNHMYDCRNEILKQCITEFVLFINNGQYFSPDFPFSNIIKCLRSSDYSIIFGVLSKNNRYNSHYSGLFQLESYSDNSIECYVTDVKQVKSHYFKNIYETHLGLNLFIGKTKHVSRVGWKPDRQHNHHEIFCYELNKKGYKSMITTDCRFNEIKQINHPFEPVFQRHNDNREGFSMLYGKDGATFWWNTTMHTLN